MVKFSITAACYLVLRHIAHASMGFVIELGGNWSLLVGSVGGGGLGWCCSGETVGWRREPGPKGFVCKGLYRSGRVYDCMTCTIFVCFIVAWSEWDG